MNSLNKNRNRRARSRGVGMEPLETRQMMSVTTILKDVIAKSPSLVQKEPARPQILVNNHSTASTTAAVAQWAKVLKQIPVIHYSTPGSSNDYVVRGTSGNDRIEVTYTPETPTGRSLIVKRNAEPTFVVPLSAGQRVRIEGLDGNDYLRILGSAPGTLFGGAGNDTLIGGDGADLILGYEGNDWMDGGMGGDTCYGGAGADTIDYSSRGLPVSVTLGLGTNDGQAGENDFIAGDVEIVRGGSGNDQIIGTADINYLYGNGGNDTIRGGGGMDYIYGGAGNDVLYADAGFYDRLYGEAGNDTLYGGSGPDYMYGGAGDDIIVSIGGSQTDYVWGQGGFDSFWVDAESTERIWDATAEENKRNVHRVKNFTALKIGKANFGSPSRELLGQNIVDPKTTADNITYSRFTTQPLFGARGPIADDVQQGGLGDCYFLASLSAIAKTSPNVIRQSVVALGDGTFAVQLRRSGTSHFVRVDADLPVNSSNQLVYAGFGSQNSMWAPIMEKAWAFFRNSTGTYAGAASGIAEESFKTLGMSWNKYNPRPWYWFNDTADKFARSVDSLLRGGNAVTLCTDGGGVLVARHCYMVDRVIKVNGKIESIVLRNPWATDGSGGDSVDDGYITLSPTQALKSTNLLVHGKA